MEDARGYGEQRSPAAAGGRLAPDGHRLDVGWVDSLVEVTTSPLTLPMILPQRHCLHLDHIQAPWSSLQLISSGFEYSCMHAHLLFGECPHPVV